MISLHYIYTLIKRSIFLHMLLDILLSILLKFIIIYQLICWRRIFMKEDLKMKKKLTQG